MMILNFTPQYLIPTHYSILTQNIFLTPNIKPRQK